MTLEDILNLVDIALYMRLKKKIFHSTLKNINGGKVAIEDSSYQYDRFSKIANIHDEIMAIPMNDETLLGELGNSLSGGQK